MRDAGGTGETRADRTIAFERRGERTIHRALAQVGSSNGEDNVDVAIRPRRVLVLFAVRLGGDRGHDLALLGQDAREIYARASEQRCEQQLGRLDAGLFSAAVGRVHDDGVAARAGSDAL
jgi:hypothetical protein